jgi:hypothetical protein
MVECGVMEGGLTEKGKGKRGREGRGMGFLIKGEIQWHGRERVQPRVIGERNLDRAQPGSTESG